MTAVTPVMLATVIGAASSSTTTDLPFFHHGSSQSDYSKCIDTVKDAAAQQYPSTKSWWQFWKRDANAAARGRATIDGMKAQCGLPPA